MNIIQNRYTVSVIEERRSDLHFITADRDEAVSLLTELRDRHGYSHLSFLTAVDYPENSTFQLTYMLHNYREQHSLGVRVIISREETEMESIHHLWKQAATYQRELKEMFGIVFPESPGLEEPFILEGWQGPPPMRRDFDTRSYSVNTYFPRPGRKTNDPRQHMQKKLYPEYTKPEDEER